MPAKCSGCGFIEWVVIENVQIIPPNWPVCGQLDDIPSIDEGQWIYVINEEHTKYLDPGIIVDKSHIHYRVIFTDGKRIWMPEHWVELIPDAML